MQRLSGTALQSAADTWKEPTPIFAVSRTFTFFEAGVKDWHTLLHHLHQHISGLQCVCVDPFPMSVWFSDRYMLLVCGSRKHGMSKAIGNPHRRPSTQLVDVGSLLSFATVLICCCLQACLGLGQCHVRVACQTNVRALKPKGCRFQSWCGPCHLKEA